MTQKDCTFFALDRFPHLIACLQLQLLCQLGVLLLRLGSVGYQGYLASGQVAQVHRLVVEQALGKQGEPRKKRSRSRKPLPLGDCYYPRPISLRYGWRLIQVSITVNHDQTTTIPQQYRSGISTCVTFALSCRSCPALGPPPPLLRMSPIL